MNDILDFSPNASQVYKLADQIVDLMEKEGVTLADLLIDLPQIREEIYQEQQAFGK